MSTPFGTTTAPASLVRPASDAQLGFVVTLLAERDWNNSPDAKHVSRTAVINLLLDVLADDEKRTAFQLDAIATADTLGERLNQALAHCAADAAPEMAFAWAPLSISGASKLIEWLKSLQTVKQHAVAERQQEVAVDVPAGRYAVATEDGAVNALAFYKVDRPTEGRWAGYVFVKLMVSDDEQKLSRQAGQAVLKKIAAIGAEAASAAYGHHIGECGVCGRTLTNDDSRARGIGPKCAAGLGW